jgi:hypothetical protein
MGILQTPIQCLLISMQGGFENDKVMHAPTYTHNKVMQVLELVGVVELVAIQDMYKLLLLHVIMLWVIMIKISK